MFRASAFRGCLGLGFRRRLCASIWVVGRSKVLLLKKRARRNCRARFFSVDIVVERPGFAQAGQPRRLSPHGFVSLMMPHAIPVKKNQHFVYLKSRNEVI